MRRSCDGSRLPITDTPEIAPLSVGQAAHPLSEFYPVLCSASRTVHRETAWRSLPHCVHRASRFHCFWYLACLLIGNAAISGSRFAPGIPLAFRSSKMPGETSMSVSSFGLESLQSSLRPCGAQPDIQSEPFGACLCPSNPRDECGVKNRGYHCSKGRLSGSWRSPRATTITLWHGDIRHSRSFCFPSAPRVRETCGGCDGHAANRACQNARTPRSVARQSLWHAVLFLIPRQCYPQIMLHILFYKTPVQGVLIIFDYIHSTNQGGRSR